MVDTGDICLCEEINMCEVDGIPTHFLQYNGWMNLPFKLLVCILNESSIFKFKFEMLEELIKGQTDRAVFKNAESVFRNNSTNVRERGLEFRERMELTMLAHLILEHFDMDYAAGDKEEQIARIFSYIFPVTFVVGGHEYINANGSEMRCYIDLDTQRIYLFRYSKVRNRQPDGTLDLSCGHIMQIRGENEGNYVLLCEKCESVIDCNSYYDFVPKSYKVTHTEEHKEQDISVILDCTCCGQKKIMYTEVECPDQCAVCYDCIFINLTKQDTKCPACKRNYSDREIGYFEFYIQEVNQKPTCKQCKEQKHIEQFSTSFCLNLCLCNDCAMVEQKKKNPCSCVKQARRCYKCKGNQNLMTICQQKCISCENCFNKSMNLLKVKTSCPKCLSQIAIFAKNFRGSCCGNVKPMEQLIHHKSHLMHSSCINKTNNLCIICKAPLPK